MKTNDISKSYWLHFQQMNELGSFAKLQVTKNKGNVEAAFYFTFTF